MSTTDYFSKKEVVKNGIRVDEVTCYIHDKLTTDYISFLDVYLCISSLKEVRENLLGAK